MRYTLELKEKQVKQTELRLELLKYRLSQAEIRSQIDGVIAEGEYEEKIGSPVQKGNILFRISGLEHLYLDLDVKESDIHEVTDNLTGEAAFSSQPKLKFPIRISHIEPIAQAKEQENIFVIRCQFTESPESWWRPGMNGVAKIDVGKRPVWWILSHRTIDFLRLWLWY
jgi:multidrug efflux pump subunit AcrA (membrane-fusion protein)